MEQNNYQLLIKNLTDRTKRLERQLKFSVLIWIVTALLIPTWAWKVESASVSSEPKILDSLTLRRLTIVDDKGTERVVIGAPLPEPIILGKRTTRGATKSNGMLLFDEEGNERGGYVTTDGYPNILLTLDSFERQHALFMTEPQGATSLMFWDGGNSFQFNANSNSSKLKMTNQGKTIFEQPTVEETKK